MSVEDFCVEFDDARATKLHEEYFYSSMRLEMAQDRICATKFSISKKTRVFFSVS